MKLVARNVIGGALIVAGVAIGVATEVLRGVTFRRSAVAWAERYADAMDGWSEMVEDAVKVEGQACPDPECSNPYHESE